MNKREKQTITFKVDDDALWQIVMSAQSNYWLEEYRTTCNARRKRLTVRMLAEPVSGYEDVPVSPVVTVVEIAEAIARACEGGDGVRQVGRFLAGNADGLDCDVLLQLAVFGRVVYG